MPEDLTGLAQHHIRGNEPAQHAAVIPALEVVEPRLGVVDISPVPERVQLEEVEIPGGVHAGCKPAPRIVIVFYHLVAVAVNDCDMDVFYLLP